MGGVIYKIVGLEGFMYFPMVNCTTMLIFSTGMQWHNTGIPIRYFYRQARFVDNLTSIRRAPYERQECAIYSNHRKWCTRGTNYKSCGKVEYSDLDGMLYTSWQ